MVRREASVVASVSGANRTKIGENENVKIPAPRISNSRNVPGWPDSLGSLISAEFTKLPDSIDRFYKILIPANGAKGKGLQENRQDRQPGTEGLIKHKPSKSSHGEQNSNCKTQQHNGKEKPGTNNLHLHTTFLEQKNRNQGSYRGKNQRANEQHRNPSSGIQKNLLFYWSNEKAGSRDRCQKQVNRLNALNQLLGGQV